MISNKELQFINTWAKKTPYPGREYSEETCEILKEAFQTYKKDYENKEYDIILSNSEEINFEILQSNICHMLGISTKDLLSDYHSEFRKKILGIDRATSYELIEAIVDNIDKIMEYEDEGKRKILNYYRIRVKCAIFDKMLDLSKFNFGCINFDKEKFSKENGYDVSWTSTKLLYSVSNEAVCPYFMVGIKPEKNTEKQDHSTTEEEPEEFIGTKKNEKYIVESLMAPYQPKQFFINQEVVIPTQILTNDGETFNKKIASPNEKLALLNTYKAIINKYQIPNRMNIYGDYETMLSEIENSKRFMKRY